VLLVDGAGERFDDLAPVRPPWKVAGDAQRLPIPHRRRHTHRLARPLPEPVLGEDLGEPRSVDLDVVGKEIAMGVHESGEVGAEDVLPCEFDQPVIRCSIDLANAPIEANLPLWLACGAAARGCVSVRVARTGSKAREGR
jgi:hypothetical protein